MPWACGVWRDRTALVDSAMTGQSASYSITRHERNIVAKFGKKPTCGSGGDFKFDSNFVVPQSSAAGCGSTDCSLASARGPNDKDGGAHRLLSAVIFSLWWTTAMPHQVPLMYNGHLLKHRKDCAASACVWEVCQR